MNWVDIVVIAIIALTTIVGLSRGLFESILSLVGTGLSIFIAIMVAKPVAKFLNSVIKLDDLFAKLLNNESGIITIFGRDFTINKIAAFCTIIVSIIVVWILIKLAIWLLSRLFDNATAKSSALSGLNRVLGLFFGIVKGAVIVAAGLALVFCLKVLPFVGDKVEAPIKASSFTSKVYVYIGEWVGDKLEDRIDSIVSSLIDSEDTEDTEETVEEEPAE